MEVAKPHQTVLPLPPPPLGRSATASAHLLLLLLLLLQGSSAALKLDHLPASGSHAWTSGSAAPSGRWSPHTTVLIRLMGLDLELPTVPLLLPPPPPPLLLPVPPAMPPMPPTPGGTGESGVSGV